MKKQNSQSSRQWALIHINILFLLISSACQTLPSDPPSVASESGPVSAESDVEFGSGSFNFTDTAAGLTDLSSYKSTLALTFNGSEAGQSRHWSKAYVMLAVQQPSAHQLTIETTGDNPDLVLMAEVDGAAYERRAENGCTATEVEEGNLLSERLEPAGFLNGVIGAEEAGNETVNNVAANHYTFDERAFGQEENARSTGEMWVASDGGYILKYLLTTEGNSDYFGEEIEGTLTWDYQLTDINQPVSITLPDDCPPGMVAAPLLPDASNVQNMPGMLTYDTSTELVEVAAFYQEEIPNLGWELQGEATVSDTSASLDFMQGDKRMAILISPGDNGSTIQVLLGKAEE